MSTRFTKLLVASSLLVAACGEPAATNNETPNNDAMNGEPQQTVTFENLRVEEVAPTRVVVRFETSVPTSCEAEYGSSADALDATATDPDMAEGELSITHEVPLEDLQPETTYYWRARAVDEAGQEFVSEVQEFTTLAADSELPPLQNFAIDGTVDEVSSNFGGGDNDSTWGANKAFDGQMSTEWATDGDGDDAMLRIDLGSERKITHFAFRSRKMTDGTSIIEKVQVTFGDGEPLVFDTPDPDERYIFALEMAQAAQSIVVEAVETTGGNTGAKEIEFLGTPKE